MKKKSFLSSRGLGSSQEDDDTVETLKNTTPLRRVISITRFLILFAVVGSFFAAMLLLIYGLLVTGQIGLDVIVSGEISTKAAKKIALSLIEVVDLFLLATVFYIITLGLLELFIDPYIPIPAWLEIRHLDDLKNKLISVVIVVMAVFFLGQLITWNGERDLLKLGGGIALVIASLTYFLKTKS